MKPKCQYSYRSFDMENQSHVGTWRAASAVKKRMHCDIGVSFGQKSYKSNKYELL